MVLRLLSPLKTLWFRGELGGLSLKTVAGRWRLHLSPGPVSRDRVDAGTVAFPELPRRVRDESCTLEWETAAFSIRLRLLLGKRRWQQWQPPAALGAGAEPTSGPGPQLEGPRLPSGRSCRYSQALWAAAGEVGSSAGPHVGRCPHRAEWPVRAAYSASTPLLSLWFGPGAAGHFLFRKDVLSAHTQRPPGSNIQVVSGSFDLYSNSFLVGQISSPAGASLLVVPSAPYRSLYGMCVVSGCAFKSLLPSHRNSGHSGGLPTEVKC